MNDECTCIVGLEEGVEAIALHNANVGDEFEAFVRRATDTCNLQVSKKKEQKKKVI